jgi:ankyrin repeat protein
MEALAFDRMDFRRAAVNAAYADTCQWILKEERFLRWTKPEHRKSNRGLFWIKGKPGSGKSTLMKCILEHLQRRIPGCTVISFFFNARGGPLERSTEGCYRSLLYQMLEQVPRLRTSLRITNVPRQGQDWEIAVLRDGLREAVLQLRNEALILMIDALDECDLQEVRDMVDFLDNLAASTSEHSIDFNTCFASRHYPAISVRFCESLILETEICHTEDIRRYIYKNLHIDSEAQRRVLVHQMIEKSQGIFMWVVLVTRRLNEQYDQGAGLERLEADLRTLPVDLDTLIQNIISNGGSDVCLLPTLVWTLCTNISEAQLNFIMTFDEFCFAIQFCAGKPPSPHRDQCVVDLKDVEALKRFVLHSSKGLVEIISQRPISHMTWQFVHESVRQHILGGGLATLNSRLHRNVVAIGHAVVAGWCQEYLRCVAGQIDFAAAPLSGRIDTSCGSNRHDVAAIQIQHSFPLLSYVKDRTFDHMQRAYLGGALYLESLCDFPRTHWINTMNVISSDDRYVESTASFTYLCLENITDPGDHGITRGLLEYYREHSHPDTSEVRSVGAMDQNSSAMLYGRSFNEYCGGSRGSPLCLAALHGYTGFVELLLKCGANINVSDDGSDPLLGSYIPTRQDSVVFHFDATIELPHTGRLGTILAAAAWNGDRQQDLVRLLLHHGADPNIPGGDHGSALGSAIYSGQWRTTSILLVNGADINLEDSQGCNIALRQAVEAGAPQHLPRKLHENLTDLLFQKGAQATPAALGYFLHVAAAHGQTRIIEMLVHNGADPNCRDTRARTALHTLAEVDGPSSRVSTATLLLNLGLDVNILGGEYDTALIAAAAVGKVKLVRLLLCHGAHTQHRSNKHGTAMDAACASKLRFRTKAYKDIVHMLSKAD